MVKSKHRLKYSLNKTNFDEEKTRITKKVVCNNYNIFKRNKTLRGSSYL